MPIDSVYHSNGITLVKECTSPKKGPTKIIHLRNCSLRRLELRSKFNRSLSGCSKLKRVTDTDTDSFIRNRKAKVNTI